MSGASVIDEIGGWASDIFIQNILSCERNTYVKTVSVSNTLFVDVDRIMCEMEIYDFREHSW